MTLFFFIKAIAPCWSRRRWKAALTIHSSHLCLLTPSCPSLLLVALLHLVEAENMRSCLDYPLLSLLLCYLVALLPCCLVSPCWRRKIWDAALATKLSTLDHLLLETFPAPPGKLFPRRRKPWCLASIWLARSLAKNQLCCKSWFLSSLSTNPKPPWCLWCRNSNRINQRTDHDQRQPGGGWHRLFMGFWHPLLHIHFDSLSFLYHHDDFGIAVWIFKSII